MLGAEHGLALGDPQRVRRDPGVESQPRVRGADLGGQELADGPEQLGTGGTIMGPNGLAVTLLQRIGHGQRSGMAQREQDVPLLLADPAAEHRQLDRGLGAG